MTRCAVALAALSFVFLACDGETSGGNGGSGGDPGGGGSGGSGGNPGGSGGGGSGGDGGSGPLPCSAPHGDQVILIDQEERLYAFDPRQIGAAPFQQLAPLSCAASETPAAGFPDNVVPFSLTVDRQGVVWVLYTSGEIFQISLRDPTHCAATAYVPGHFGTLVALAFSSDVVGGSAETLFTVTGNPSSKGGNLGRLDTTTLMGTNIGSLPRLGDLSPTVAGDRGARLFLFAPGIADGSKIQQIKKTDAQGIEPIRTLPGFDADTIAYAYAVWGGKHYAFRTQNVANPRTSVTAIDRESGMATVVVGDAGSTFIAAGVSTCAPDAP